MIKLNATETILINRMKGRHNTRIATETRKPKADRDQRLIEESKQSVQWFNDLLKNGK